MSLHPNQNHMHLITSGRLFGSFLGFHTRHRQHTTHWSISCRNWQTLGKNRCCADVQTIHQSVSLSRNCQGDFRYHHGTGPGCSTRRTEWKETGKVQHNEVLLTEIRAFALNLNRKQNCICASDREREHPYEPSPPERSPVVLVWFIIYLFNYEITRWQFKGRRCYVKNNETLGQN